MTDHVMCHVIFSRMNRGMTERDLQIVTYNPNYTIPEKGRPDSNWFFFSFKHTYSIFPEPLFLLDISGYKCNKSVNSAHHFEFFFWKTFASIDFLEEKLNMCLNGCVWCLENRVCSGRMGSGTGEDQDHPGTGSGVIWNGLRGTCNGPN